MASRCSTLFPLTIIHTRRPLSTLKQLHSPAPHRPSTAPGRSPLSTSPQPGVVVDGGVTPFPGLRQRRSAPQRPRASTLSDVVSATTTSYAKRGSQTDTEGTHLSDSESTATGPQQRQRSTSLTRKRHSTLNSARTSRDYRQSATFSVAGSSDSSRRTSTASTRSGRHVSSSPVPLALAAASGSLFRFRDSSLRASVMRAKAAAAAGEQLSDEV